MVVASFSIEGLIYKILIQSKQTTIRELNEKWERELNRYISDKEIDINLEFWWKQRSQYGFKFLDSPVIKLELYRLKNMSEKDAILDGGNNKKELLGFFKKKYGDDYLTKDFIRIWWDLWWHKESNKAIQPNKTNIDWFDSLGQKLFTINPFIFHKGETKRINLAKRIQVRKEKLKEKTLKSERINKLKSELKELQEKYKALNESANVINCMYDCLYCYARNFFIRMPSNYKSGFYESRLKGLKYCQDNVFIESISDLFHDRIPDDFIQYIIERVNFYNNQYNKCQIYFLTKNPTKYLNLIEFLDPNTNWIGTTIESDTYEYQNIENITQAPNLDERIEEFSEIKYKKKFLSIEPNLRFTKGFAHKLINTNSALGFVGVNTDRKTKNHLIEPKPKQIEELILELEDSGMMVIKKDNLHRILPDSKYLTLDNFIQ